MMHSKVVVVTGGAGGIGSNLVMAFAKAGARVHAWDIGQEGLDKLKNECDKQGYEVEVTKVDVTNEEAVRAARDAIVKKQKTIDIWVNNAGISGSGDFQRGKVSDFYKVINLNLTSLMMGTHLALETMENAGSGWIVNVASVAGVLSCPFLTAYSASKHGVVGFTRALRQELALKSSTTKLLLVCPGFVDTNMLAKGSKYGFPEWLNWLPGDVSEVSTAVLKGIEKDWDEVYPTKNGKLIAALNRHCPGVIKHGSKLLLSRSFRDLLLNRLSG